MEISTGEIAAFRQGVRRHRAEGCGSLTMSDCCLTAGMRATHDYRHGELLKLITPPEPAKRCPYTERLGVKVFACAEDIGHEGEHALVAGWAA